MAILLMFAEKLISSTQPLPLESNLKMGWNSQVYS